MMPFRVELAGKTYCSQKALKERIKTIIYDEIGICKDVRTNHPTLYLELIEFLKRHPRWAEKSKNSCVNLQIRRNYHRNGNEILLILEDGSKVDISWATMALKGKYNPRDSLIKAMRNSIKLQIRAFRRRKVQERCELCEKDNPFIKRIISLQVDHHTPTFEQLSKTFLDERTDIPTEFGNLADNSKCFLLKDRLFDEEWQQYHLQNATLRILCSECNQSRSRNE